MILEKEPAFMKRMFFRLFAISAFFRLRFGLAAPEVAVTVPVLNVFVALMSCSKRLSKSRYIHQMARSAPTQAAGTQVS